MTDFPDVKVKTLVSFPAMVLDGVGVDVVKANGAYTFNLAFDDFAPPAASVTDPLHQNVLLWNNVTNTYILAPVSAVFGSGDVVGPSGAVDSNLAAFNTTTGKLIKDSGVALAAASGAVRYDTAQSLTEAQRVQVRQNIYAAPFDAMAYNGMQVNGSMDVSQINGTAGISTSGVGICDGWILSSAGTATLVAGQQASGIFAGFSNIQYIAVSVAQPSILAGNIYGMNQRIEGYRITRLAWGTINAQPITINFWCAHGRIGTYTGTIRNATNDRCYPFTYTQNVANAAEYKTITIPGPTDGTWNVSNGVGMDIFFAMAAGSTYTASSSGSWLSGAVNYIAAPGQINAVAAISDTFRISGFVVLPGIEAPSAARSALIMRPYDQELMTCMRYYEAWPLTTAYTAIATGQNVNTGSAQVFMFFKAAKRSAPILTISAASDFALSNAAGTPIACTALTLGGADLGSAYLVAAVASGLVAGNATGLYRNNVAATAKLAFDSRL